MTVNVDPFSVLRLPREILFGAGQMGAIGVVAARQGSKALICTDARFAASNAYRSLHQALRDAGLQCHLFDAVEPDLPSESVYRCTEAAQDFKPDMVIGVGGGSCIDMAKCASLILAHGGRLDDYYGEFKIPSRVLPIVAVPTTAGTGSEVTPVAVVSDAKRTLKVGISSPYLIPVAAICDPVLSWTCPPALTAIAGADALTHAIEAFTAFRRIPDADLAQKHVFVGKNAFSDVFALKAITLIGRSLERAYSNSADQQARSDMMQGALAAGCAFGAAGTSLAHAVQYPIGALTHTPHGLGVAAVLPYAAEFFRWNAEEAVRINGGLTTAPSGANRIVVDYQPIGICVLVTPWNFPAAMATRKIGPALAAGCTVILKPATETPLTAYALAALYEEAGVPPGVVNVLTTTNPGPLVAAMLADPRVRKLSFTGSTAIGRTLLAEAAKNVISCSMELGGNAPVLVFDDADLDIAIEGTMIAKMRNAGQACTAANRIYIQSGIYDAFAEGLTERMAALTVGPGTAPESECGPMISASAAGKIERLVYDARARGAKLLCGGERPAREGFYFPPTVLSDVPHDAEMAREEIFGPVAALSRFASEDEAVALANDTEYGLSAYVFTRDVARGLRVARRIDAGMVALNRGLVSDPAAPFGGMKQSGLGREGGTDGIYEFLETKYIAASI